MSSPKIPRTPALPLPAPAPGEIVSWNSPLLRVLRTAGAHLTPWDQLRHAGPIPNTRWEPHPSGPITTHPGHGVSYQAVDLRTAVAEVFQSSRRIDPYSGSPAVVHWLPLRTLQLLDLTSLSSWSLRAGASHALNAAPRPTCSAWARAIHHHLPGIDGLRATSTMTGKDIVVLFTPAANAFPSTPDASYLLSSDLGLLLLASIAPSIGYRF